MRSKTSFFNASLLKKDLLRFWPAWAIFGALLLIYCAEILSFNEANAVASISSSLQAFAIFNLIYGGLVAQLLFGDLFTARQCNALHALPIRREGWYGVHLLAGVLYMLIPVGCCGVLLLTVLPKLLWTLVLAWMGALLVQYLLFFAVGVLSAQLSGNRFGCLVFYGLINFLPGIVLFLFHSLYLEHLTGVIVDVEQLLYLCPPVWMAQGSWCSVTLPGSWSWGTLWSYLPWLLIPATVFLAVGLPLYRRRALECAGDFLAFRQLRMPFLVLFTFSVAATVQLFSQVFMGLGLQTPFLLLGLVGGYFAGLMLLERRLMVFRLRSFAVFALLLVLFGLSLLLTLWDPLGITTWVPQPEAVAAVTVDERAQSKRFAITDPALIEQLTAVHSYGIGHPEADNNGIEDSWVYFTYYLKDGSTATRQYHIDCGTPAFRALKYIRSAPQHRFGSDFTTPEAFAEEVTYFSISGHEITDREQRTQLAQALYQDAVAGALWDNCVADTYINVHIHPDDPAAPHTSYSIPVYACSTHTLEWITGFLGR